MRVGKLMSGFAAKSEVQRFSASYQPKSPVSPNFWTLFSLIGEANGPSRSPQSTERASAPVTQASSGSFRVVFGDAIDPW